MKQPKKSNAKPIRYELEVDGAKCSLAPLSFHVAEAALGFTFTQFPKMIQAGEIILNSLFVTGSPRFKNNKESFFFSRACLEAYKIIELLSYKMEGDTITVFGEKDKEYKCKLKKEIDREVLEECLGLIKPNAGAPYPLTAGKKILEHCWIEGDEAIRTNDELLVPACLAAYYRIEAKEASLKKV